MEMTDTQIIMMAQYRIIRMLEHHHTQHESLTDELYLRAVRDIKPTDERWEAP